MPAQIRTHDSLGKLDWGLRSRSLRYRAAALASFGLVYTALDILGNELRIQDGTLVIIWPAAGLLLAALFLAPPRTWIWLLSLQVIIGVLVTYLLTQHFRVGWAMMYALADSLDGVVGATLAIGLIREPAQPRVRQVLAFFAAAGLGAAASGLIGALCATHLLTDANYWHQWQLWWAGNWLGSLAIAPVVLTWAIRLRLPNLAVRKFQPLELTLTTLVLMSMTWWIFSAPPVSPTTFLQLPSILLALVVVAAFRLPPRWSTTLAAAVVLLAALLSSFDLGPFGAEPNMFARIGSLQIFLATLLVFTFMLATVLLEKQRALEQLTTSEERYRYFVSHSSEAVWRVELEQPMPMGLQLEAQLAWLQQHARVAECNHPYRRLCESQRSAPIDPLLWRADVPWSAIYVEQLETAARQGYSMDGLRFTLPGETGAQVYLTNFSGVVEDGKLVRLWGVARDITQLTDLNERLRREQERLQAYARQLIGAEERARRTMAVSLRDGVERQLAQLSTIVDAISSRSPAGLRQLLDNVRATLGEAQEHTGRLIADVSPPGLYDIGLRAALQWLAIYMRGHNGLHVALSVNLNEQSLSLETRILIFQVIRELLRNVAAHARIDSAEVRVSPCGDELTVEVTDKGVGFDWQYDLFTDPLRGFGLFSVVDRVRSANGRVTVDTAPGKGCRVTVHFPLSADPADSLATQNVERRA